MTTSDEIRQALETVKVSRDRYHNGLMRFVTFDIDCTKFQLMAEEMLPALLTENARLQAVATAARALVLSGITSEPDMYIVGSEAYEALQTALAALARETAGGG